MNTALLLVCSLCLIERSNSFYTQDLVVNKLDQVVYSYRNKLTEERLGSCGRNEVCNIVHKRSWYLPKVERLCKCTAGKCGKSLHAKTNSVQLNKLVSLKFCGNEKHNLYECGELEVGITEEIIRSDGQVISHRTMVDCTCEMPGYWQLHSHKHNDTYTYNRYHCTKMRVCKAEEFCGNIRADSFSLYQQCYCPQDSICISRDTKMFNITEALYSGPALKAFCTSTNNNLVAKQNIT